jgi:exodeoxyribonuclease-3
MKIVSWNINGIRAVCRKGFRNWLDTSRCDIVLLQEVKAFEEQLPKELQNLENYKLYWHAAQRPGYSGVASLIHKNLPIPKTLEKINRPEIDCEGRILRHEFDDFLLYNIYFPNGQSGDVRLQYKLDFYDILLRRWKRELKSGKQIIVAGDVNTAHREIDLARPRQNRNVSGFLPVECAWIDKLLESNFLDSFRNINGDIKDEYSWWSYRAGARKNNVGWRIDYFFISEGLKEHLKDAFILQDVMGSDHCPVGIII